MGNAKKLWRPQSRELITITFGIFVFFATALVASVPYYGVRPFNLRDAVISRLQSRYDNPSGHLVAAVGMVVFALLTLPAAWLFFRKLRPVHATIAWVGSSGVALGLLGAAALGSLATFSSPYDPSHIALALLTFFALSAGLAICLALVAWSTGRARLWVAALIQSAALAAIVRMAFKPDFPADRSFLSSVAFLEWVICVIAGASMLLLTALLTNTKFPSSSVLAMNSEQPDEKIEAQGTQTLCPHPGRASNLVQRCFLTSRVPTEPPAITACSRHDFSPKCASEASEESRGAYARLQDSVQFGSVVLDCDSSIRRHCRFRAD